MRRLVLTAASSSLLPRSARWALLRIGGVRTGTRAIAPGCGFFGPGVSIARGSFVNTGCLFDSSAPITIGRGTAIGPRVTLVTSTHEHGGPDERAGELHAAPISIGAGCWIGACVTVLPGVTIGDGVLVAAGAVVAGDLPAGGTYGGVPARPLRTVASAKKQPQQEGSDDLV